MTEVLRELKSEEEIKSFNVTPKMLCELLNLIEDGTISGKIAKEVFGDMVINGKAANEIINEKGIKQISDLGEIEDIINDVIEKNPDQASRYKAGEEKLIGFFVGQVMKATQGKANPKIVNETLKRKLLEN
jgi:Asp-tRNA(Asn)/Glu-tRNA(Gln) amidotransferase B subunit